MPPIARSRAQLGGARCTVLDQASTSADHAALERARADRLEAALAEVR